MDEPNALLRWVTFHFAGGGALCVAILALVVVLFVPETKAEPVAELPSPPLHLRERQQWLRQAMRGTWRELNDLAPAGSPDYLAWRQTLLDSLDRLPQNSVVFSHFIAINVAVAAALSREDVVCFWPDHASITCVDAENGSVRLVDLGRQADTTVLARG